MERAQIYAADDRRVLVEDLRFESWDLVGISIPGRHHDEPGGRLAGEHLMNSQRS